MALKLTLKPGEKFVINGAVIANGDRRATLVLHNKASILRERDILKPEEVDTPARRIYFAIMSIYLDEKVRPRFYEEFVARMSEFMGAISNPDALATCIAVSQCVMDRQYYKGLTLCRKLLDFEAELLNYEPASV
ncbi:MAG: flagellar biosynthesis repressor FlbT [Pseudomonadota bacterium]|nr:flagellar biosynthesis repressor FlbT [Pseudomonadota bacterium]